MKVLVVGGGVVGTTVAVRLQEAGHAVTIWAKDLPPHTTSDVAAAFWLPYEAAPQDKVDLWSRRSYEIFTRLAEDADSGVRKMTGRELRRATFEPPYWRNSVADFRMLDESELPFGVRSGYSFTSYLIEMPIYLRRYLMGRFVDHGGKVERHEVQVLEEGFAEAPVVVNCTGLGARSLTGDGELFPLRGQVVKVSRPAFDEFFVDDDHPGGMVYVFPRSKDCVLGGTCTKDDATLTVDEDEAEAIFSRCAEMVPAVADCRVLGHAVGLRPGRSGVRLEREEREHGVVVHCYGHGGAGVTMSWGCADEVLDYLTKSAGSARGV